MIFVVLGVMLVIILYLLFLNKENSDKKSLLQEKLKNLSYLIHKLKKDEVLIKNTINFYEDIKNNNLADLKELNFKVPFLEKKPFYYFIERKEILKTHSVSRYIDYRVYKKMRFIIKIGNKLYFGDKIVSEKIDLKILKSLVLDLRVDWGGDF